MTPERSDPPLRSLDRWLRTRRAAVAAALFTLTLVALVLTLDDPGITWDEPLYFASAQLQVEWVETLAREGASRALDRATIQEMWDWEHYFNPHPPIYKEGMALTWSLARSWLGWVAAFRLSSALLFSALVALAFVWGTTAWSGIGGLGAAASIAFMPRLFGHAHLAATETPLLVFWTLAAAGIWWAVERERRAGWVVAGVALGLAAGTKFTGLGALVIPAVWAMTRDRRAWRGLAASVGIGILVFVALNPLVWVDATGYARTWIWESTHRAEHAPMVTYYMGRKWGFDVPWHHVFVMTVAVTPLGILVTAGGGAVAGLRRRDPLVVLAVASVAFLWLVMLTPTAPSHDGIRQFIPLFPFLGLLAGYGIHRAWAYLPWRAFLLVTLLVLGPAAVQTVLFHPDWLAYYGEVVGSVPGARHRGFETTYWMDVIDEDVLEWMNASLPPDATVVLLGPELVLQRAQSYGRVRKDLRITDEMPGDYLVVPEGRAMLLQAARDITEGVVPLYRKELMGVPLLSIYRLTDPSADPRRDGKGDG